MTKNSCEKFFTILSITIIFTYTFYKLRYSIVANDDIEDFINYNFYFHHGRVFFELLTALLIKFIPKLMNESIQNFAIISVGVYRAILYSLLIFILSRGYDNFKTITFARPIMIIFLSMIPLSIWIENDFVCAIEVGQFFTGYGITAFVFFLFWQKLYKLYSQEEKISKLNIIQLSLFGLLSVMGNEQIGIISVSILVILIFDTLKNDKKISLYLLIPFASIMILYAILYLNQTGAIEILCAYGIKIILIQPLEVYKIFISCFYKRIIVENLYIIVPLIISTYIIKKNKEEKNKKILNYTYISLFCIILYTITTIYINHNAYMTRDSYPFWFCHGGLLSTTKLILLGITLFISNYAMTKLQFSKKICLLIFIVLSFSTILIKYPPKYNVGYNTKEQKQLLYKMDKMSVFYFNNNEKAILPNTMKIELFSQIDKKDLSEKEEIYTKTYYKTSDPHSYYFEYLEEEYNINTGNGITFLPNNQAFNLFFENGGKFTQEELEKLDFKEIRNKELEKDEK